MCRFELKKKNIYKYYSIKPTFDILHSLLWDGPLRKKT